MGGNFLSATPDTKFTAEALQKTNLSVQIITKLNRSALVTGKKALILPPLGRSEIDLQNGKEQFVTTENSMGNVQMSKGVLSPASNNLRSEIWIVCELAKAVLGKNWDDLKNDYDQIREAIERTIPGFENYNERVRKNGGFYLPNKPRLGEFPTHIGKANFTTHNLTVRQLEPDQFLLMTIRSHDQFNTTIYDLNDRYRGIKNERRVIFLNPEDMHEFGLKSGNVVDLTSHFEDGVRHANHFIAVPYAIPRKCAATYFPEANSLVPIGSVAEKSNTPTSKSIVITIAKNGEERVGKFDYDFQN
jgi:anaerobic selenocysteine-containing dehydrogenase